MKKEVLKLEYQDVFDKVAVKIVFQDDTVFVRGMFEDSEIGVMSVCCSAFFSKIENKLYIKEHCLGDTFLVDKEDVEIIKNKVKKINEKYGIKKRWRAEKGENYYYICGGMTVQNYVENNDSWDDSMYNLGNYFRTEEQAEEGIKRIQKVLADYQEELLKRG